jgi:hypothetical protein
MEPTPHPAAHLGENFVQAFEDVHGIIKMKQEFIDYHSFISERTFKLAKLLLDYETRGYLIEGALEFAEVGFWLDLIQQHSSYLAAILNFGKRPCAKTLRPILEIFGADRKRVATEIEHLEFQLKQRVETFRRPKNELVYETIRKNEARVLAAYLHIRSDYKGAKLSEFFNVARSTAYGWLDWFKMLPEELRESILAYMDSQVPSMAVCQVPGAGLHEPPPPPPKEEPPAPPKDSTGSPS